MKIGKFYIYIDKGFNGRIGKDKKFYRPLFGYGYYGKHHKQYTIGTFKAKEGTLKFKLLEKLPVDK